MRAGGGGGAAHGTARLRSTDTGEVKVMKAIPCSGAAIRRSGGGSGGLNQQQRWFGSGPAAGEQQRAAGRPGYCQGTLRAGAHLLLFSVEVRGDVAVGDLTELREVVRQHLVVRIPRQPVDEEPLALRAAVGRDHGWNGSSCRGRAEGGGTADSFNGDPKFGPRYRSKVTLVPNLYKDPNSNTQICTLPKSSCGIAIRQPDARFEVKILLLKRLHCNCFTAVQHSCDTAKNAIAFSDRLGSTRAPYWIKGLNLVGRSGYYNTINSSIPGAR